MVKTKSKKPAAKKTVKKKAKKPTKRTTPRVTKSNTYKKALIEALEKSLGVVTTACKVVGVARKTFYQYYNSDKNFRASCDEVQNVVFDFAESNLFKQIKDGSTAATIFFLKTRVRERGYTEVIQHEGNQDNPLVVTWASE